jgi:type VI secretion system protein ImpA
MDFDEDFQKLDSMMSSFELEGESAPLKLGQQAFSWESVIELSEAILQRGADLRVAIWWVQALAVESRLSALVVAFQTIEQWLKTEKPDLYPQPEEGESREEVIALNLSWLGSDKFISVLQKIKIDEETELQQLKANPTKLELNEDLKSDLVKLHGSLMYVNDFMQAVPGEQMYDIAAVVKWISDLLSQKQESAHQGEVVVHSQKNSISEIKTRDDVAKVITSMMKYFQEHEPGHPAPILLERVQRMLGASFQEILKELYQDAPQLVSRIERPQGN